MGGVRMTRISSSSRLSPYLIAVCVLGLARSAEGACDTHAALHSCLNADALWPHAGPSRFIGIGAGSTTEPGTLRVLALTTYLSKPITLRAPSTTASGLQIPVIAHAIDIHWGASLGLTERLELEAFLPIVAYQSGAGIEPYTSSRFRALPSTAVRDPRIGVACSLHSPAREGLAITGRLATTLPFGNKNAFSSEPGAVLAPSLAADFRTGRFVVGTEVGIRARSSTRFANATMGSQAFLSLGIGIDVLDDALGFGIEAFALPVLAPQPMGEALVPAEWMADIRSAPFFGGTLGFALGAGTALPVVESAVTAPAFRAMLSIGYIPFDAADPP